MIGVHLCLSYRCSDRSRRQTPAGSIRNACLVNCDRSYMTDPGRVAALTRGSGPCESWFRALLFCCRGGSASCVPANGGTRRRCRRADQARG